MKQNLQLISVVFRKNKDKAISFHIEKISLIIAATLITTNISQYFIDIDIYKLIYLDSLKINSLLKKHFLRYIYINIHILNLVYYCVRSNRKKTKSKYKEKKEA